MTLQTTINGIDEQFPIAGQDNNSQGFRDNFSYIKNSLLIASQELSTLETNSVLKGGSVGTYVTATTGTDLTVNSTVGFTVGMEITFDSDIGDNIVAGTVYYVKTISYGFIITITATEGGNTAITVGTYSNLLVSVIGNGGSGIENNLLGSSLVNGYYGNFHGISYVPGVTSDTTTDIDIRNGPLQVFDLAGNNLTYQFRFAFWPENNYYANVRVHFKSSTGTNTITFSAENAGIIKKETGFPVTFSVVGSSGKSKVIEAWTYDGGVNIFVKYLGEF